MSFKSNKLKSDEKHFRVSIFRSNRGISAQIIDDEQGVTLVSASSLLIKEKKTPADKATETGINLAKLAKEKKIVKVVFDRGKFRYHGQVKALAEGLRSGGLEF